MTNNTPQIKRIAAIHDLCGYGKCSLGTALPVLSAAGFEVIPIPTGLFSTQTAIDGWEQLDTTTFLPRYVGSLSKKQIKYDAIYSGFLCSKDQIYIIQKLYTENLDALRILDPVMGDCGKLYKTCTEEIRNGFKEILSGVDILTPNMTEACALSGIEYSEHPSGNQIESILESLKQQGVKNIILKGVRITQDTVTNIVCQDNNKITEITSKYYNYKIHGCGDLFASSIIAALLNGKTINDSCQFASDFVSRCVKYTLTQLGFEERGVSFEPLMYNIVGLIDENQIN